MEFRGLMGIFYRISDWVTRVVYLNLLWILFSLFGGVVLGIMPATSAMCGVAMKWVSGERDIPTFAEFQRVYRAEFKRSNGIGWCLLVVGVVFLLDIRFFAQRSAVFFEILKFISSGLFIVYVLSAIYVFPTLVRFRLRWTDALRLSFVFAMTHLIRTVLTLLGICVIAFCGFLFPSFGIIAGVSLIGLWIARNVQSVMTRAEQVNTSRGRRGQQVHPVQKKS